MEFDAALARKPTKEVYMIGCDCSKLRRNVKDERGNKYGKLTVVDAVRVDGVLMWQCECECGKAVVYPGGDLRKKYGVKSCGCSQRSGKIGGLSKSLEHKTWIAMKGRCLNKNDASYYYYGGRGVAVCERWKNSFMAFLEDMGPKPFDTASIDRIDVNGDYEPGNCRWVGQADQCRNTTRSRYLEYRGRSMIISDWAREIGISPQALSHRIDSGWSVSRAIETKPGPSRLRLVEYQGEKISVASVARKAGISPVTLAARLRAGFSLEESITQGRVPRRWRKKPNGEADATQGS